MALGRRQEGRACGDAAENLADFRRQRTQAEESAAGHLARAGRSRVVGVIVHARMFGDAMIDHIGMGQAVGCMLAMAEGKRSRRHDEAKCRERCENDRELEAQPGSERGQHGFEFVFYPCNLSAYSLRGRTGKQTFVIGRSDLFRARNISASVLSAAAASFRRAGPKN
jgi:hypothetical protein